MIILGIIGAAILTVGATKTVRLVATDGYGRVPTQTHPNMFSIR